MSQTLSYLTYAQFANSVNAMSDTYMWDLMKDTVEDRADLQTEVEDRILKPAHSTVNGYISKQRSVPVASSSQYYEMIQEWVLKIAWYKLEFHGAGNQVREKLRLEYEDTLRTLRDVAKGTLVLVDDTGAGPDTTTGMAMDFISDDAEMDEDNFLDNF